MHKINSEFILIQKISYLYREIRMAINFKLKKILYLLLLIFIYNF